ncbi:hypothetical protein GN244_ATG00186 [Phytophthora infestans]|uniref:Uncharacterized protein n=1 Tax=Phytophthora infestans TaxID=4787 RepID=A0A833SWJ3_PHYIN|nr:hypothetical protein GN244_ATG00186 [Phytophthora infestans]
MKGNDGTVISAEDTATTADVVQQLSAVVAGMQTRVGKHGYYRGRRATVISCSGWNADKDGTQRRRAPLPIKWRRSHRCRRSTAGTRVNAGPSRVERSGEYGYVDIEPIKLVIHDAEVAAIGNKWLPTYDRRHRTQRRDKIERKEGRQDAGDLSKTDGTISDDREEERRTVTIVENAKNSMAVPDERHLGKQEVVALSYQTTISRTILLATMTQARWQSTQ